MRSFEGYTDFIREIPGSRPVTKWYRKDPETGEFRYNHYSDGVALEPSPTPESAMQKSIWPKSQWRKKIAVMVESTIYDYYDFK